MYAAQGCSVVGSVVQIRLHWYAQGRLHRDAVLLTEMNKLVCIGMQGCRFGCADQVALGCTT